MNRLPFAKSIRRKRKKVKQSLLRKTRLRKKNPARKAKRFETDFGGAEYHALIVSLPCAVCGIRGYTVAAHLTSRGAGGKAKDVAPLCSLPQVISGTANGYAWSKTVPGCHDRYDAHDPEIRAHEPRLREEAAKRHAEFFGIDLQQAARETEDAWVRFKGGAE